MISDKSWDHSLPSRVKNALKLRGIFSLAQLVAAAKEGEIQCMRNCGKQGMDAVYKLIESAQTPGAVFSKASEMSLRDYFAGQAVGAIIAADYANNVKCLSLDDSDAHPSLPYLGDSIAFECPAGRIAVSAYEVADAMLAMRKGVSK